ncbi:MAG: ABC transporter permease [Elusimicrobia bacterium RIFOXYB2_FULL_49_7]|nr:MAG: ABC transporter permease [Elusimicrobia bacterium RIFOXYB2_FULL_49_7]
MTTEQLLQYLLSGITIGSIYAITAIGYNIIYNATGIINFAQGEFLMIGAMTAISLSAFMPLPLAIVCAIVITALVGALIEIIFIRPMKKPSVLQMIIVTIGLSILLREAALHIWDEKVRALPFFTGSEVSSLSLFGAHVSPQVIWVLAISALMVVLLNLFFKYSLTGKSIRACSADRASAKLCGIPVQRMITLSFMLSAAIGAVGGCILSPITQTQYDCGTSLAIKGFATAVLGGLGNSTAAVTAGLLLGLLETFSIIVLPLAYKDAVSIALLLIILFVRPSGLFGNADTGRLKEF